MKRQNLVLALAVATGIATPGIAAADDYITQIVRSVIAQEFGTSRRDRDDDRGDRAYRFQDRDDDDDDDRRRRYRSRDDDDDDDDD